MRKGQTYVWPIWVGSGVTFCDRFSSSSSGRKCIPNSRCAVVVWCRLGFRAALDFVDYVELMMGGAVLYSLWQLHFSEQVANDVHRRSSDICYWNRTHTHTTTTTTSMQIQTWCRVEPAYEANAERLSVHDIEVEDVVDDVNTFVDGDDVVDAVDAHEHSSSHCAMTDACGRRAIIAIAARVNWYVCRCCANDRQHHQAAQHKWCYRCSSHPHNRLSSVGPRKKICPERISKTTRFRARQMVCADCDVAFRWPFDGCNFATVR